MKILSTIGFDSDKMKYNSNHKMISCPRIGGDNPNGLILYTNTLHYQYNTIAGSGNIFSLVMEVENLNFPNVLERIGNIIGFNHIIKTSKKYPFNGFYKKIFHNSNIKFDNNVFYDESSLPDSKSLSQKFFLDGISFRTQEEWGIRYDHEEDSVLIPIIENGKLIGCKARNNDPKCPMNKRWWAYLPYSKTQIVYGFDKNYKYIISKNIVFIFESEKAVLQSDSFNFHCSLAIGGHNISKTQVLKIKSLMVDKIVIAFDEGVPEEEIIYNCKKLKNNSLFKTKIGYIYDDDNSFLDKGSKDSPTDIGEEGFRNLIKNKIHWIGD